MFMMKRQTQSGAPEWMVTYGDCMGLLLCLFIVLFSMSEIKKDDRFLQVMGSINEAFGNTAAQAATLPTQSDAPNTLIAKLCEMEKPIMRNGEVDSGVEESEPSEYRVIERPDGIEIVLGGHVLFARFSARLMPEGRGWIARTGELLHGYRTKVVVRGHATREALPPDSAFADARDLSYERARAVADELTRSGVEKGRITLVAVGDNEPLVQQAFAEDSLAMNRRVEILVMEERLEDVAGSSPAQKQGESSDGG